jgi:hypothetical protein
MRYAESSHMSSEVSAMAATLCYWENLLGPYHPNTLCLTIQLGIALAEEGDHPRSRVLLERAARDIDRHFGRDHTLREQASAALARTDTATCRVH